MKSFHILTFGCQMNYADNARIKTILLNCGFSYQEKQENADIIILVTCSVRQKSEDKITGLLKDIPKDKKIWITGCMIQHNIRNKKISNKKLPQNLKIGNFLGTINTENYEVLGLTTKEINNTFSKSPLYEIESDFNQDLPKNPLYEKESEGPNKDSPKSPLYEGGSGGFNNSSLNESTGTSFTGFYLPYNPKLKEKSQELRKSMTKAEKKIRYDFLKSQNFNTARQKIINNYIVDFYIASAKLAIEIDGDTHGSDEEILYDQKRTKEIESYGLKVLRFTNKEIYDDFEEVCNKINSVIKERKNKTPNPLSNKGGFNDLIEEQKSQKSTLSNKDGSNDIVEKQKNETPNPLSNKGGFNDLIEEPHIQTPNKGGFNANNIIPINHAFNPQFFNLKKTFENLELFWRIDDTGFLPKILEKIGYKIDYNKDLINEYEKIIPENHNTSMNIRHKKTAYVPVSTGCNQFCSYCIVPYARGLERYFEVEEIINECQKHLDNGAKEIVLLGQIVNKHPKFTEIIQKILQLKGLKWLRYTSPYPTYYSNELLKLHETEEKLCPHIHIPFQSGSNLILKSMNRGYNSQKAKEFIDKIRSLKRDISITTDIIVGFPNESEQDFQETLDLIEYGKFDMIYIGIYSPRPGTFADKNIPDNIDYKIKYQRREQINKLLNKTSKENNKKEIGNNRVVLINDFIGIDQDGNYKYEGYTDNMKQIIIQSKKQLNIGDFISAEITDGSVFKLYGKSL